ncbi:unnamed protein product, partial [Mesorhabditis belari]|uniref:Regulatory protein zeste n=1 Tax=Mesorhabditis belari TaxID=2138241 RepID=A0AAF3E9X4_9BILA
MHYRKREAKMRTRSEMKTPEADVESPPRVDGVIHEDDGCFVMEVKPNTSDGTLDDEDIETDELSSMNENLQAFLQALTGVTKESLGSSSPALSMKNHANGSCEDRKLAAILRKDRAAMVDTMAKYYLKRLCFDGTNASIARSQNINQERHAMWRHISEKVNAKYAEQIGYLTVEQTKKLFSNLKRKSRAKKDEDSKDENNGSRGSPDDLMCMDDDFSLSLVRDAISKDNLDLIRKSMSAGLNREDRSPSVASTTSSKETKKTDIALFDSSVFTSPPASSGDNRLDELLKGLDKTLEVQSLRDQLTEREAECERLKRKIEEQAEDYRKRTQSMLDLIRVAVDRKAADDVQNFLRI